MFERAGSALADTRGHNDANDIDGWSVFTRARELGRDQGTWDGSSLLFSRLQCVAFSSASKPYGWSR